MKLSISDCSFDDGVLREEIVEVRTCYYVGRERDAIGGAGAIAQKALQNSERELALGAGTLMDGGRDHTGAEVRHKIGKQIGRDHGDVSFSFCFFESAQDGNGVGGCDVAADERGMIADGAQSLVGRLFCTIVGFDGGQDAQMRIVARDAASEAFDLLDVIGGGEFTGEDGNFATLAQKATHEIADETSAGARIDGDGGDAVGAGGVGDDADDGNITAKSFADAADKLTGMSNGSDDAVHTRFYSVVEGLDFANTEAREAAEFEVDGALGEDGMLGLDAGANVVEERGDLFRKIYGDAEFALGRENAGRQVGPVAHGLGHLLHALFGDGIDAGPIMQGAVYRADRDFERLGYVDQPDHARPF